MLNYQLLTYSIHCYSYSQGSYSIVQSNIQSTSVTFRHGKLTTSLGSMVLPKWYFGIFVKLISPYY